MENFKELFKKKLAEQQFDGKEKYWAQLEEKLNESAQEKVVIAWYKKWLLPVMAIVITGTLALLYNNSIKKNATVKNIAQTSSINDQALAAQKADQSTINNIENKSNTSNNTDVVDEVNLQAKIQNEDNNKHNELIASDVSTQINTKENKSKTATPHQQPSTNNTAEKNIIYKNAPIATNTIAQKEPVLSNSDIEEINLNNVAAINKPFINANSSNDETNNASKNKSEDYALNNSNSSNKALDFSQVEMPLAFLSPKALSAILYPASIITISDKVVPVSPKKPKIRLSLSAYGGAMLSLKSIITQDGNTAEYLNRRKTEESKSVKPNAGMDVELKYGHWSFTSGINFHQQGEKRNYTDEFKRIVPYDSLVMNINNNSAWIVDSTMFYALQYNSIITNIDTTITYYDETTGLFYTAQLPVNITQSNVVDTNFYYHIDSTYHQVIDTTKTNYALKKQIIVKDPDQANLIGRNTFTYVEVPILIGYEWGLKRWRLSLKGGLGLGILSRQQSFYLSTDEAEIAPVSTDVYTKVIYNGIFRLGMHYSFTSQFGIDIVPFSRLNFNNMTNKNAAFQQKYSNVGMQLGLSYKLK